MQDKNFPLYLFTFVLTLISTVLLIKIIIPILSKRAKQPIFEEGPSWHMKKSGTPTMGGIGFLISASFAMITAAIILHIKGEKYFSISLVISSIYAFMNGLIGFIDDYTKLKRKENAGLTPKQKLFLQTLLAVSLVLARNIILNERSYIYFSFGSVNLGILYYPLVILALVGCVNCANLTDGIDGLAAGVAFAIGMALFYISYSVVSDVAVVSCALLGASLGFLFFNIHPAKIFMGDTGSLFFGALISSCALALGNFLLLAVIGIVYVIEGISVIIQVLCFKVTGKRVFKMAPIHHHLEKCGWSENKIVLSAIFITLLISIPAYIMFV